MKYTLAQIKAYNTAAGSVFFSKDTMRFFANTVSNPYQGDGGVFLITYGGRYGVTLYKYDTETSDIDFIELRKSGWTELSDCLCRVKDVETARKIARQLAKGTRKFTTDERDTYVLLDDTEYTLY